MLLKPANGKYLEYSTEKRCPTAISRATSSNSRDYLWLRQPVNAAKTLAQTRWQAGGEGSAKETDLTVAWRRMSHGHTSRPPHRAFAMTQPGPIRPSPTHRAC